MNKTLHCFSVEESEAGRRLDQFLAARMEGRSRSQIQKWIKKGSVRCSGRVEKGAYIVVAGDQLTVDIPEEETRLVPEELPLDILFEDSEILAVHKRAGQMTHPAPGRFQGTLANAVFHHLKKSGAGLAGQDGSMRPGIVHRLDRDTSGVLIIAKTTRALGRLSRQFHDRAVQKTYRAIVCGQLAEKGGSIEGAIGRDYRSPRMAVLAHGRSARTEFQVLKRWTEHSYLEVRPQTGRTHQIRVHLAKIGFPVMGDAMYGRPDHMQTDRGICKRQMLHAYRLRILHPGTGKALTLTAPIPEDFERALASLSAKSKARLNPQQI